MPEPTRWQAFRARMAEPFRVTVQREETFEEVNTYSLNLANLSALALTALLLASLGTFALVAVTPLRSLMPGYGAVDERSELVEINRQLREIEHELEAQESYADNVRDILVGDVAAYDAAAAEATQVQEFSEEELEVARIPEDEALRQSVSTARTRYRSGQGGAGVPIDQLHFLPPVSGTVSDTYDARQRHFGLDVVAPAETPVKSTLEGYVVEAGWTLETGNVIAVQHPNNLLSFYKHNAALLKRTGDYVEAGEAIALVGNTGERSSGPHLHFELWHMGRPLDPLGLVPF